jgi:heat shock protein HslJ
MGPRVRLWARALAGVVCGATAGWVALACHEGAAPPAAASFTETSWHVVEVRGKPIVAADSTRVAYLVFRGDGRTVNGSSGCNRVIGQYDFDDNRLRVWPLGGTRMMCPDGMAEEQALLAALHAVTRARVDADTLRLFSWDTVVVRLVSHGPAT